MNASPFETVLLHVEASEAGLVAELEKRLPGDAVP